jgi:hypothetical protein
MIPAPNSYYLAEEAKRQGAHPRFRYYITPYNFSTGVAAGSGTFVNCAYVDPGRIQVTPGVTSASWISPALQLAFESYPVTGQASWVEDSPGYNIAVSYRTGASPEALAAASWIYFVPVTPMSLEQYYQLRFEWTGMRCLFSEIGDAGALQFNFTERIFPVDPDRALFSEGTGTDVYIGTVQIAGEYPIDPADIQMQGDFTLEAPLDFSDLVKPEHALFLVDPSGFYDPDNPGFIFAGETLWYGKDIRVEFGFQRPGTSIVDTIKVYQGRIVSWKRYTEDMAIPYVEIYSTGIIGQLLNSQVAPDAEDGTPQPLAFGVVLIEADEAADLMPQAPVVSADFETGNLNQLSSTEVAGANSRVEVSSAQAYRGTYSCRTYLNEANAAARAKLYLAAPNYRMLGTAWIYVSQFPPNPNSRTMIAGMKEKDGTQIIGLYPDVDTRLWVKIGSGSLQSTDCFLASYLGMFVRLSIGVINGNPGLVKIWVDGDEIFTKDNAAVNFTPYEFWAGIDTGDNAETWEIFLDNLEAFPDFYPALFRVYGAPYQEITDVYDEGRVLIKEIRKRTRRQKKLDRKLRKRMLKGRRRPKDTFFNSLAQFGSIDWIDWVNYPSGTVLLRVRHDGLSHPIDIIQTALEAWGAGSYINLDKFAAAKAAIPGYQIGCYFEDGSRADALQEITSRCLLTLYEDQGEIRVNAFTGAPLGAAVMEITADQRISRTVINDLTELIPKVNGCWSWSDRNPDLHYEKKDQALLDLLGDDSEEIDFSWGQPVMSENSSMVKTLVSALYVRVTRHRQELEVRGRYDLARLELGDPILCNGKKYEIYRKTFSLSDGMTIGAIRFEGVSQ